MQRNILVSFGISQLCQILDLSSIFATKNNTLLTILFFSNEHFSYVNHNCQVASRRDNQVPVCPVCFSPVASEAGREDYAVSEHMDKFCNTQTKIYTNNCTFKNCKKKELVKITCSKCKMDFCLKHRHENAHKCMGPINHQRNIMTLVNNSCFLKQNCHIT